MTASSPNQFTLERCPHCGSDARLDPHPELRFKCRACGRPRIPLDAREPTPAPVAALLKQAGRARAGKLGWSVAGWGLAVLAVCSVFTTLLAGWLFGAGFVAYAVMGFFTLVPVILSLLTFRAAKRSAMQSQEQLAQAWSQAVGALYRAREGRLDASALAQATGIDTEYATELLAEAEVQQLLGSGVDEPVRVRVDQAQYPNDQAAAEQELPEALGHAKTESFKTKP